MAVVIQSCPGVISSVVTCWVCLVWPVLSSPELQKEEGEDGSSWWKEDRQVGSGVFFCILKPKQGGEEGRLYVNLEGHILGIGVIAFQSEGYNVGYQADIGTALVILLNWGFGLNHWEFTRVYLCACMGCIKYKMRFCVGIWDQLVATRVPNYLPNYLPR